MQSVGYNSYSTVPAATGDGAVLYRGESQAINSYNILQSPFATYVSENDARKRGLRVVSEEIRLRLAAFLTRST